MIRARIFSSEGRNDHILNTPQCQNEMKYGKILFYKLLMNKKNINEVSLRIFR